MGDLVSLKRFKKRSERVEAAKKAEINRALHGRSKSEKKRDQLKMQRASTFLDGHRIDDETST